MGLQNLTYQEHSGGPVRIIIIGAGLSGIALYIRLLQYVPDITITIFEKNAALGGTWFENCYPGVACDIPSHVYQYSFEPNTQWSQLFASGAEILEYVKGVADKYRVTEKIKYNTKVVGATWDDDKGVWIVKTKHDKPSGESEVQETEAEIVISAVGILNNWKWPEIGGLDTFEGKLLHSANWDTSWGYAGKTVALLGCGSSAIQILPHLQKKSLRVHNFIRGGTWISQPFGSTFTEEELQRFESDTEYYQTFRREEENFINKDFPCLFPGSPEEKESARKIKDNMRAKLAFKSGLYEPEFTPGCRRLGIRTTTRFSNKERLRSQPGAQPHAPADRQPTRIRTKRRS